MTSAPSKPGMAFWATVVVVTALIGYPLSFGPVCWFAMPSEQEFAKLNGYPAYRPIARPPRIYYPLCWLAVHGHDSIASPIRQYAFIAVNIDLLISGEWSDY